MAVPFAVRTLKEAPGIQAGDGLKLISVTQQLYVTMLYEKRYNSKALKQKNKKTKKVRKYQLW